ncbi:hypothetical protein CEUSTIGMA_g4730.t1 [Chlamydomonas eustigma]|uniref:RING-type domain-containing protein n=1 Tax=Chlamydomonas eustigma TaxID=1157962 RepID=A0A250X2G0_9CHLO|nr:hypothetical protein CEUSTIGMA_g4730.t1 [Chlamydomonas eustigma]|eukprot:GAX77284.1 hypothetical protein CEUSTIGMA_g4730.t1 [Chlamydomonas eustigma]
MGMGASHSVDSNEVQNLLSSLTNGDLSKVSHLLARCPKLYGTYLDSSKGHTVIHSAIVSQQHAILEYLLRATKVPKDGTNKQEQALHKHACAAMDKGRSMDGATPLMIACKLGDEHSVRMLLEAGADPWRRDENLRRTCLHYAASRGHTAVMTLVLDRARMMIDHHNRSIVNACTADCGFTPLMYAAWFNHPEVIRLLLSRRADIKKRSKHFGTLSSSSDIRFPAWSTALHVAAAKGSEQAAFALLSVHQAAFALLSVHQERRTQRLDSGDIRSMIDGAGRTPFNTAMSMQHRGILLAMLNPLISWELFAVRYAALHAASLPVVPTLRSLAAKVARQVLLEQVHALSQSFISSKSQTAGMASLSGCLRRVAASGMSGGSRAGAVASGITVAIDGSRAGAVASGRTVAIDGSRAGAVASGSTVAIDGSRAGAVASGSTVAIDGSTNNSTKPQLNGAAAVTSSTSTSGSIISGGLSHTRMDAPSPLTLPTLHQSSSVVTPSGQFVPSVPVEAGSTMRGGRRSVTSPFAVLSAGGHAKVAVGITSEETAEDEEEPGGSAHMLIAQMPTPPGYESALRDEGGADDEVLMDTGDMNRMMAEEAAALLEAASARNDVLEKEVQMEDNGLGDVVPQLQHPTSLQIQQRFTLRRVGSRPPSAAVRDPTGLETAMSGYTDKSNPSRHRPRTSSRSPYPGSSVTRASPGPTNGSSLEAEAEGSSLRHLSSVVKESQGRLRSALSRSGSVAQPSDMYSTSRATHSPGTAAVPQEGATAAAVAAVPMSTEERFQETLQAMASLAGVVSEQQLEETLAACRVHRLVHGVGQPHEDPLRQVSTALSRHQSIALATSLKPGSLTVAGSAAASGSGASMKAGSSYYTPPSASPITGIAAATGNSCSVKHRLSQSGKVEMVEAPAGGLALPQNMTAVAEQLPTTTTYLSLQDQEAAARDDSIGSGKTAESVGSVGQPPQGGLRPRRKSQQSLLTVSLAGWTAEGVAASAGKSAKSSGSDGVSNQCATASPVATAVPSTASNPNVMQGYTVSTASASANCYVTVPTERTVLPTVNAVVTRTRERIMAESPGAADGSMADHSSAPRSPRSGLMSLMSELSERSTHGGSKAAVQQLMLQTADQPQEEYEATCGVCLDTGHFIEIQACKHKICVDCALELLRVHPADLVPCPFCRGPIKGFRV